jgi:cell division protein FtsN
LAVTEYEAGRFAAARTKAVEVQTKRAGLEREQAAYLAGLCAYQLSDFTEAERRLTAALETKDAGLRAQSQAMLGLVRLEQERNSEAARLLESASRELTGQQKARATYFAGQAHEKAGNGVTAGKLYAAAATGNEYKSASAGGTSGFSIQVGAFQDATRAHSAAEQVQSLASVNGLNPVRVVQSSAGRGKMLYVVQFGSFDSRQDAERTRRDIGRLDYIVARAVN